MTTSNPASESSAPPQSPLPEHGLDTIEPSPRRGLWTVLLALAGVLILVLIARRGSRSDLPHVAGRNLLWFRTPTTGQVDLGGTPIESVRGNWIRLRTDPGTPVRWLNLNSVDSFALE